MMRRYRILFVGMHHSIHVARWIKLIANRGWDLHFFPVDPAAPNPDLRGVILHWPSLTDQSAGSHCFAAGSQTVATSQHEVQTFRKRIIRFFRFARRNPRGAVRTIRGKIGASWRPVVPPIPADRITIEPFPVAVGELGGPEATASGTIRLGESDAAAPILNGPGVLASLVRELQPDLIHSMEFQHAGYLVLKARELYGSEFPKWLATNWGSDIFYFRRFPDHEAQIRRLLAAIDFYSCECKRDISLAREYGYAGPVLPALPNSGGFDMSTLTALRSPIPPSKRRLLMIKGYHHFAGRAMTSMKVLETFADRLQDYEIVLYSVSSEPRQRAFELKDRGVLNIKVIDLATHAEILQHFGQSRLYMGISISDAISTSVLEAMAMGAFPIQSNTSCCDEWFEDGIGGYIVPPENFDLICDRFERALIDDGLVDRAAAINEQTIRDRLSSEIIGARVSQCYREVLRSKPGTSRPFGKRQ
jgi:glycosyltransferase involved in cell wall biosynthesis